LQESKYVFIFSDLIKDENKWLIGHMPLQLSPLEKMPLQKKTWRYATTTPSYLYICHYGQYQTLYGHLYSNTFTILMYGQVEKTKTHDLVDSCPHPGTVSSTREPVFSDVQAPTQTNPGGSGRWRRPWLEASE
jgi:hypothetical protein